MVNWQAYFSRKKNYGFNLQAICNWNDEFIWACMKYTASMSDSKAWKSTGLYQEITSRLEPEEYILADKAYGLERYIITPFKDPAASLPNNTAFNYEVSKPRVKIEHAFGVLKARWPTLYEIPVRIGMDEKQGHQRVHYWAMACLVLHNLLYRMRDKEAWLQAEIDHDRSQDNNDDIIIEKECYTVAQQAGITCRDELRNLVASLHEH